MSDNNEVTEPKSIFTAREEDVLKKAWSCLKSGPPEVDFKRMVELKIFNTEKTATNVWGVIKKKLATMAKEIEDGATAEGEAKTETTTVTPKKRGKKAASSSDDNEEAPATKTTKKRGRKAAAATGSDNDEDAAPKKKGRKSPAKNTQIEAKTEKEDEELEAGESVEHTGLAEIAAAA